HKTFTGPHGAGGPGSGPIAVRQRLEPFLPVPSVVKTAQGFRLDYDRPKSVGRVRSFFGNVGILVRGYCYIRTLGPAGLRPVREEDAEFRPSAPRTPGPSRPGGVKAAKDPGLRWKPVEEAVSPPWRQVPNLQGKRASWKLVATGCGSNPARIVFSRQ